MSKDIYIVYETTNLVNGKFYIGVHRKNGKKYLGSGKILKQAIKKYGNENFMREILREYNCEEDAYLFEKKVVGLELVGNINCYNIVEGGGRPPTMYGKDNPFYGKNLSEKTKRKISEKRKGKCCGKDHPFYGHDVLKDNHENCYEMYKKGKTLKEIAEYFSVGDVTVYRCLLKNKECKILMNQNNTVNKRLLNDSQIIEVKKMYKDGFSLRYIGRHFSVSHHTIKKYLGGK